METSPSQIVNAAPWRPPHGAPPEWALLLAALSHPADVAMSGAPFAEGVWQRAADLAENHGCLPLLHWSLSAHPSPAPAALLLRLKSSFEANVRRNLMLGHELLRALQWMNSAGIPALAYKGPAMAEAAYGHLGLRVCVDLDILVPRKHVPAAIAALRARGYVPQQVLSEASTQQLLRDACEFNLLTADGSVLLELHWDILHSFYAVELGIAGYFERAQEARFAGAGIHVPSHEDLLLALAAHGAKHNWNRLAWVLDIAKLAAIPSFDWAALRRRARTTGTERMLDLALLLAHRLCGAGIPARELAAAERDAVAARLANQAMEALFAGRDIEAHELSSFRFFAACRERWTGRLLYRARVLLTPGPREWEFVRLPAGLRWLYPLVRLGRLALLALRRVRAGI